MEVPSQQHSSEHQSFRHNFQAWVDSNYGEHSRTKTITRAKYTKICRYLMGEEVETDAKFRFWVKSKAFRILRHQLDPNIGVLCVPVSVSAVKGQVRLEIALANYTTLLWYKLKIVFITQDWNLFVITFLRSIAWLVPKLALATSEF